MKTESSLWADEAEFYHDKNGLMVGGPQIVDAITNNLCGKVKRELVPGTLEVYPLAGYGAVEIGVHRFLHPWEQDHGVVGEAKFIHVWRYKDGLGRLHESSALAIMRQSRLPESRLADCKIA